MKALLIYWCIGCVVVGGAAAGLMNECPNDDHKIDLGAVAAVAIWPAPVFAALVLSFTDYKAKPTQCVTRADR